MSDGDELLPVWPRPKRVEDILRWVVKAQKDRRTLYVRAELLDGRRVDLSALAGYIFQEYQYFCHVDTEEFVIEFYPPEAEREAQDAKSPVS